MSNVIVYVPTVQDALRRRLFSFPVLATLMFSLSVAYSDLYTKDVPLGCVRKEEYEGRNQGLDERAGRNLAP